MYSPSFENFPIDTSKFMFHLAYENSFHTPDDPSLDPSHVHSGYEFYVNLSGDVCFLINNTFYPVKRGDVIITKPNDMHICVYNTPCFHEHFCLWIDCDENSPLLDFTRKNFTNKYSFADKTKNKLIDYLFNLKDSKSKIEKSALLLSFLSLFIVEKNLNSDKQEHTLPPEMQKILDYIDSDFTQIHNIREISDKFFISSATLNRWFKKYLQLSPREFLEARKLSYAQKLLSKGVSVNNVCIKSGFTDCSYFISVFKKKFGETPLKYCKKNN